MGQQNPLVRNEQRTQKSSNAYRVGFVQLFEFVEHKWKLSVFVIWWKYMLLKINITLEQKA